MKKFILGSLAIGALTFLSACNNSSENAKLNNTISSLKTENSKLKESLNKENTTSETSSSSKVISSEKGNSEMTPSIKINDMNLQNDKLKLSITEVDFLGNLSSSRKSEGLVVLYFTMENKGTDKIDPLLTVSDYLEITEEDNVSDDELSPSFDLFNYKEFEQLDKQSRLNIKTGSKIDGAVDYPISDVSKTINIKLIKDRFESAKDDNLVGSKSISPAEIEKSINKNSNILPK
ncbi:TPA: DUF5067 domain-containing protein [Enterococcus faecalis]|nr:DUF5067 domain-containing protein [Enterococcus faecalis]